MDIESQETTQHITRPGLTMIYITILSLGYVIFGFAYYPQFHHYVVTGVIAGDMTNNTEAIIKIRADNNDYYMMNKYMNPDNNILYIYPHMYHVTTNSEVYDTCVNLYIYITLTTCTLIIAACLCIGRKGVLPIILTRTIFVAVMITMSVLYLVNTRNVEYNDCMSVETMPRNDEITTSKIIMTKSNITYYMIRKISDLIPINTPYECSCYGTIDIPCENLDISYDMHIFYVYHMAEILIIVLSVVYTIVTTIEHL
jgi:hypothetical protein